MKIKVLSLDVASTTGWCIDTQNLYGTWDLKTLKDESMGMKLIRLKAKLQEIHKVEKLDVIIYERPAGQHVASVMHQSKMIAIIEKFCEEVGINYRAYSAKEIKKFATDNGNCGKQAMVDAAKTKYGYTGEDDNIADAMHMLGLFNSELNN
jgi:Holliday junction resolvasome RuvABC endonuclease subunit